MNDGRTIKTPKTDATGNPPLQVYPLAKPNQIRQITLLGDGTPEPVTLGNTTTAVKFVIYPNSKGMFVFYGSVEDYSPEESELFMAAGNGAYATVGVPDSRNIVLAAFGTDLTTIKIIEY